MSSPPDVTPRNGPPLWQRFRHDAGHSTPTADTLAGWVRAFILFHDKRHPDTLDRGHVAHFLDVAADASRADAPAPAMSPG